MTIQTEKTSKSSMILYLSDRLDANSAPLLDKKLKQREDDITELTLDFASLTYISSLGLRVLLQAQKAMNEQGHKLIIRNMNQYIREVFEISGFINLMTLDEKQG
jgi:anti-sigma B factor antagonist